MKTIRQIAEKEKEKKRREGLYKKEKGGRGVLSAFCVGRGGVLFLAGGATPKKKNFLGGGAPMDRIRIRIRSAPLERCRSSRKRLVW